MRQFAALENPTLRQLGGSSNPCVPWPSVGRCCDVHRFSPWLSSETLLRPAGRANVVMGVISLAVVGAIACGTPARCDPSPLGYEVRSPAIHASAGASTLDGGTPVQVTVEAVQAGCVAPTTNPSAHLSSSIGTFSGATAETTVVLAPMGDGFHIGSAELRMPGPATARIDVTVGQVKACRLVSLTGAGGGSGIVEQDCAP